MATSRSSFSNPTQTRVPSPDPHTPWGSFPTGIVVTREKSSVRKTWTWFRPPTVTYANVPSEFRTIFTWFVIGPVPRIFSTVNGGRPLNTMVLPTSFSVNHTCPPSGVTAMLGENEHSLGIRPPVWGSLHLIHPRLAG